MKKEKIKNPFSGKWLITEMDEWDRDFINLVEAGFTKFDDYLRGELLFGCVGADLDCRIVNQDENPKIEFTFQGEDEGDPVCGRGWAQFNGKRIQGKVFFHLGDESGFFAMQRKQFTNKILN